MITNQPTVQRLSIALPPSANQRMTVRNGVMVLTQRAREYKTYVGWMCRAAHFEPIWGNVEVKLTLYLASDNRDSDNAAKLVLDGMKQHAYYDDIQVTRLVIEKVIQPDDPRLEIVVTYLSPREGRL
jgi:Holliday junction resolvase RusA-like endonuclease